MEVQRRIANKHSIEEIEEGARRLQSTHGFSKEEALELSAIEGGYESYDELAHPDEAHAASIERSGV